MAPSWNWAVERWATTSCILKPARAARPRPYNALGFYERAHIESQGDDDSRDQENSVSIRQIQGVLLLLVLERGVLEKGFMLEAMTLPEASISSETLESIGSDPTMALILRACKMDQPLPDAAKVALVDRDIAFFNDKGNLILTDAGKIFFEDLFSQRSSEN